jgi:uncharacterized protein
MKGEHMNRITETLGLQSFAVGADLKLTTILLASSLLPALQRCWGSIEVGEHLFGRTGGLPAPVFMFAAMFVIMGVLPLILLSRVLHESPGAYGLQLGDWRVGGLGVLILAPIIAAALLYPASQTEEIRAYYPFARSAASSWGDFLILEGSRVALFYTAWEFFFRGFVLFGLANKLGVWPAICIQTIPQCLWHIGMPNGELLSSIAGGILFGLIALRTRSIVWPFMLHSFIGVCLDVFVITTH